MGCFERFNTLGLAMTLLSVEAAQAECYVCDEMIELTKPYAECFMEKYEAHLEALAESATGRISINTADCAGTSLQIDDRGLPGMGGLPIRRPEKVKSVYVLDRDRATCLHGLLSEYDGPLDPKAVFDLAKACERE